MRYNQIKEYDTANGEGIRVSLWTQGCSKRCKDCFNKETWDFTKGQEFTDETIQRILHLLKDQSCIKRDFSVLGGEPLELVNIPMLTKLIKTIKLELPNVKIWLWTNNLFEDVQHLELIQYLDVLVDGAFIKELHSLKLKWRGSSNQRVIDVQETLKHGEVILYVE